MRIVQEFENEKLQSLLKDFYQYFSTGFEFEEFLKPFLENIGLTEVVVTKKTNDGGVDLTAVKNGLQDINNVDNVKYRIQAKRNSPSSIISPEKIDALRGNLGYNEKGLLITTARVSEKAKEQAVSKDPYKPVFVIDGIDLIRICIDKQIGFAYLPVFSKSALDEFTGKNHQIAK
ncbi:MAG: restriction endonuclease, partial [Clostridia bacterium]|nr:restriction endonuclease [Clostridia bacterium]